jgi:hypothetical protein
LTLHAAAAADAAAASVQDSHVGLAAWIVEKACTERLRWYVCTEVILPTAAAAACCQDSPVGLAAWILEKVRTWSDCRGTPDNALSKDEILTNIAIYWFGGRIASSMRLYKETLGNK